MTIRLSRRALLKGAAAAVAAPYIIPAGALGQDGRPAPSNRIVMGAIGLGGMGSGDTGSLLGFPEIQYVAVCDVERGRREKWKADIEKRYAAQAASGEYKGCTAYGDFRELVTRPDLDAVNIATPDHWHALPVIWAAKHGKDMYCQKPLSLTIAQGRAMSDAVRRYGRVFQTGSQQRSDGRFRFACELVRNGRIGKLHTIRTWLPRGSACPPKPPKPVPEGFDYDMWLGPAPFAPYCDSRTHWDFRWILDYSGGQVTDWGAHHNDIAQWGHGTEYTGPVEVEGRGEFPKDGLWNAAMTYEFTCTYADGVKLICSDDSKGENGLRFEGSDGWVYVNRGRIDANPKSLLQAKIGAGEIHLYESPGHYRDFVNCVQTRRQPIAPIEQAHRSIAISHLGNIAMLLGRKIKWDPDKEVAMGDAEAQRMTSRAMRAPWHL